MTDRPPISPECPQLREDAAGTAPQRPGSDTQGEPNKRPSFTPAQRLATFEAFGALVCCQEPGCENVMRIKGCDIDHDLALIDGGKHELANWRPLCDPCHAKKSAHEHRENCRAKRRGKKHRGEVVRKRPPMRSRGFDKTLTKKFSGEVVRRG